MTTATTTGHDHGHDAHHIGHESPPVMTIPLIDPGRLRRARSA